MAAANIKKFALDSNVLFDLAEERDFAHTFREVSLEKGFSLLVPPTVVQELTFKSEQAAREKELALRALTEMRLWGISPYDLTSVGHGITERFSDSLAFKGLLPDAEFNDGLIIAEVALANIQVLVTSDGAILGIDAAQLMVALDDFDLAQVVAMHPKYLATALS